MAFLDFSRNVDFFRAIPWTRTLLEDEAYLAVPINARKSKKTEHDTLVAETLNTKDTIKAWLTMQKKSPAGDILISETRTLLSLGHYLIGYPGVIHGGIVGLIFDEAMGTLLQLNDCAGNPDINGFIVTASLKTTFVRPIPLPSIILVTAKLREQKGRKIYLEATIANEASVVLALGEALWISAKKGTSKEPHAKL